MDEITVEMYPVGLGSAMLLEFKTEGDEQPVRIIADGGVGHGRKEDEVLQRLLKKYGLLYPHAPLSVRIDLIVGTHYDKDHLAGLVPIIEHKAFDIGEIWLPPIIDDTLPQDYDGEGPVPAQLLLGVRLADMEMGEQALAHYLRHKRRLCHSMVGTLLTLSEYTEQIAEATEANEMSEILRPFASEELPMEPEGDIAWLAELAKAIATYREVVNHSEGAGEAAEESQHAAHGAPFPPSGWGGDDDDEAEELRRSDPFEPLLYDIILSGELRDKHLVELLRERSYWRLGLSRRKVAADASALMALITGQARDAVNAKTLLDVVKAVNARNQFGSKQIEVRYQVIETGQPQLFGWDASSRRFVRRNTGFGPSLTMLAPSQHLVRKHRNRLPTGSYAAMLSFKTYPLKRITPSNQLSYVIRAEHMEQGILISGDTGLVDFVEKIYPHRVYRQSLLNALLPLHVIQVAHHGGSNWYFYEVLMKAGLQTQLGSRYLLLSHDVDDPKRPTDIFADFIRDVASPATTTLALFTSCPLKSRVATFRSMIADPTIPKPGKEDIVRLLFNNGEWSINHHGVQP